MRLISLTRGHYAQVDDDDFEFLSQFKWYAVKPKKGTRCIYAAHNSGRGGKSKYVLMHRLLLRASKGQRIDHEDRNGLNNQRYNLRFCTNQQNIANSQLAKKSACGFRGVSWSTPMKKWRARIGGRGKEKVVGYYTTPEDAARARDAAAIIEYGAFAMLNFKETQ